MDFYNRRILKIILFASVIIIFLIIEFFRMRKRRKNRSDAAALGQEKYLKYLKTEYHELKFRYDTAKNQKEQQKWLREMSDIEQKIIQTERDLENN